MVCFTLLTCLKYSRARLPFLNTIGQHHSANIYYTHILIYIHLVRTDFHHESIDALIVYLATIPLSYGIIYFGTAWKYIKKRLAPDTHGSTAGKKIQTSD